MKLAVSQSKDACLLSLVHHLLTDDHPGKQCTICKQPHPWEIKNSQEGVVILQEGLCSNQCHQREQVNHQIISSVTSYKKK